MLSELQRQNIGSVFDALDSTGNGVLTRADFDKVVTGLTELFELPPGSPRRATLAAGYLGWWEQIRAQADGDQDGEVTRDEYIAAVDRGLLEDPHYLDAVGAASDGLFAAADGDGSGTLSEAELVGVYGVVGVAAEVASGAFKQLDTDGDGAISKTELRAAVQGVFASKGPEDLGAGMLGNA